MYTFSLFKCLRCKFATNIPSIVCANSNSWLNIQYMKLWAGKCEYTTIYTLKIVVVYNWICGFGNLKENSGFKIFWAPLSRFTSWRNIVSRKSSHGISSITSTTNIYLLVTYSMYMIVIIISFQRISFPK